MTILKRGKWIADDHHFTFFFFISVCFVQVQVKTLNIWTGICWLTDNRDWCILRELKWEHWGIKTLTTIYIILQWQWKLRYSSTIMHFYSTHLSVTNERPSVGQSSSTAGTTAYTRSLSHPADKYSHQNKHASEPNEYYVLVRGVCITPFEFKVCLSSSFSSPDPKQALTKFTPH